ncbi:chromatin structure-remodeling complex subunit rsc7 [Colletotrichum spaethianum]|uniref:Chromatin structure-remodeling complex subunit rsc7 n=1 Tax=Colletotrichum spaethianum TaxID=700344 RepID=A0AA37L5P8_9PEZI|nr:chromatin structure-remodeling complex subunit rsc7 [Colletotrichum spaethianum]GKT40083.1 chromatin structure-remodeling complex subunit rsc7 [Colletotrichum spaethianum]
MYSTQPNGADSATINPAALNSPDLLNASTRGIKRSRSPDNLQGTVPAADAEPERAAPGGQAVAYAPAQASPPPKTTPTKTTLKALPTVRDHTTDQLNPAGDEYLPREIDEFGEKKVMPNGQLLGGREYRCRTFLVPNRGDKLFMLATECARVLGYRDSYLLFNKNRSLYKIIASQPEKDDLVSQEILPFSYRSRQIAIVTARSMFRQFGSRVIVNGRRVRDDYWETKARKQGFTEADPAGEKRPGAAKAREAAAEAQNQVLLGGPHGEIVYSNTPSQFPGAPQPQIVQPGMLGAPTGTTTRMPVITLGSELSDNRPRDYSGILKGGPRQEITGPAYQDQTRPAQLGEVHTQAHHAAEYNRTLNQQREMRGDYLQGIWRRPHEQPQSANLTQNVATSDAAAPTTRATQSPHTSASNMPQSGIVSNQSPQQMMMTAPPYSQSIHAQNPISQAPMRGMAQPSSQKNSKPTTLPAAGSTSSMPQGAQGYHYPGTGQMWPQTQQNPQQHNYSGYTTQGQQSHQQPPAPQLRHANSGVQPGMQFSGMPGMGQSYGAGQGIYPTDQTPRQYMPQPNQGSPAVTQAWSNQQTPAQWWTNQPQ